MITIFNNPNDIPEDVKEQYLQSFPQSDINTKYGSEGYQTPHSVAIYRTRRLDIPQKRNVVYINTDKIHEKEFSNVVEAYLFHTRINTDADEYHLLDVTRMLSYY